MADQDTSALKALNDLIATCRDAEEGYAKAAKGVPDNAWSDWLAEISGWRGDEGTLKHYAHALDQQLPGKARAVVERQRSAIQSDLDALQNRISHGKDQHA